MARAPPDYPRAAAGLPWAPSARQHWVAVLLSAFPSPQPRLPLGTLGAEFAIGATFLIHIAIVGYILGAAGIAPFMELAGRRPGASPNCLRYARGLAHSVLYLYSFGATWAVFAVVLLTGLYGRLIGTLLNLLLLPLTIAFASFFVGIPLLLLYVYGWGRLGPRLHLAVGLAFALIQYLFLFMIVQLDSFALTPGTAVSAAHAMYSPSYPWLLLHYAGATLSWSALVLAAIAVWRARRAKTEEERQYHTWTSRVTFAIGSIFLLAQPISGFLLAEAIKTSSIGAFDNLFVFNSGSMFIGQVGLLAVVVVGANLVFWLHRGPSSGPGAGLTAISLLGMAGTALPAAVLPSGLVWLRYTALFVAFVATAINLGRYLVEVRRGGAGVPLAPMVPRAMGAVAVAALALTIFMGVVKENAKLPCGIDAGTGQTSCLLSLHQSAQNFNAPPGTLP